MNSLNSKTGWVVCRNFREFSLPDTSLLPRWAEQGRVRPDDYLVHPAMEICLQARQLPELAPIFRMARLGSFGKLLERLGLVA
jgi:hypothetical protein